MNCNLCPKKCNAERNENVGLGVCGMSNTIKIAHWDLFEYEEPCISLNKGSGAIFFSGCNLKCVFCQNYQISTQKAGKNITIQELVDIFKQLENMGAENINLVSAMHFALQIVEALKIYKPKIPVIYNTNAYESEEIIKFVSPYVDVFLPDFKYYSTKISLMLSNVSDYFDIALKSIKKMRELKQDVYKDGKIFEGVIIRHMILPLCTDDSLKILKTIKENFPTTKVSLMAQYTPCGDIKNYKFLNRKITKREYDKVLNYFTELNLDGYIQDLESSDKKFIPNFKFI